MSAKWYLLNNAAIHSFCFSSGAHLQDLCWYMSLVRKFLTMDTLLI